MEGALIIIGFLSLTGICGFFYVKHKVKKVLSPSQLEQLLSLQKEDYKKTPKSVSSMTKIFEPQINRDFPEFNWIEFSKKAELVLSNALLSITKQQLVGLELASDDLRDKVATIIAKHKVDQIHESFQEVKIHRTEITDYKKSGGICIITLQSALQYYYSKSVNGEYEPECNRDLRQVKYNFLMMYIQDADKLNDVSAVGVNCPNCGAPLTSLGQLTCPYCGSGVVPVNTKAWHLNDYYEVQ